MSFDLSRANTRYVYTHDPLQRKPLASDDPIFALIDIVCAKWELCTLTREHVGTCGNFSYEVKFSDEDQKFFLPRKENYNSFTYFLSDVYVYNLMPCSLAVHRFLCLFPFALQLKSEYPDGDKVAFDEVLVQHKKSREIFGIGDFKGCTSWRATGSLARLPRPFVDDYLEIVNLLISPKLGQVFGCKVPVTRADYLLPSTGFVTHRLQQYPAEDEVNGCSVDPAYERIASVNDIWRAVDIPSDMSEFTELKLGFDPAATSAAAVHTIDFMDQDSNSTATCALWEFMPVHLLAYRLVCIMPVVLHSQGGVSAQSHYATALLHEASNAVVVLKEEDGIAKWFVSPASPTPAPKVQKCDTSFRQDVVELMKLLHTFNLPHPYDGTVAGSVA